MQNLNMDSTRKNMHQKYAKIYSKTRKICRSAYFAYFAYFTYICTPDRDFAAADVTRAPASHDLLVSSSLGASLVRLECQMHFRPGPRRFRGPGHPELQAEGRGPMAK